MGWSGAPQLNMELNVDASKSCGWEPVLWHVIAASLRSGADCYPWRRADENVANEWNFFRLSILAKRIAAPAQLPGDTHQIVFTAGLRIDAGATV